MQLLNVGCKYWLQVIVILKMSYVCHMCIHFTLEIDSLCGKCNLIVNHRIKTTKNRVIMLCFSNAVFVNRENLTV